MIPAQKRESIMEMDPSVNVLGGPLEPCSTDR